jgi:mono/diheme cytochrome c family protein
MVAMRIVRRRVLGSLGLAVMAGVLSGCNTVNQPTPPVPGSTPDPATPEFYTGHVKPIFEKHCFRCHAGLNHRGGLSMATQASMMKGGKTGRDIVPGDPAASLMVKLIRHEGTSKDPENMPSKSARLADADVATVEQWIRAGALMPPDPPKP